MLSVAWQGFKKQVVGKEGCKRVGCERVTCKRGRCIGRWKGSRGVDDEFVVEFDADVTVLRNANIFHAAIAVVGVVVVVITAVIVVFYVALIACASIFISIIIVVFVGVVFIIVVAAATEHVIACTEGGHEVQLWRVDTRG